MHWALLALAITSLGSAQAGQPYLKGTLDLKQQNCGSIYESTPWLKETNDTSLITLSKEELNKQWVHFVGEI